MSEYLHTSQNATIMAASSTPHIIKPHHVLNGIKSREYEVVRTEIALVIIIIIIKYVHVIEDSPATKQSISSGKSGSRNIIESNK